VKKKKQAQLQVNDLVLVKLSPDTREKIKNGELPRSLLAANHRRFPIAALGDGIVNLRGVESALGLTDITGDEEMSEYKIEKIPYPGKKAKSKSEFPFAQMNIGECIVVPKEKYRSAAMSAMHYAKKSGKYFVGDKLDDGRYAVWRLENPE
jgi:hypothetical protein